MPDLLNATLRESLEHLQSEHQDFLAAFAEGKYAFWIGSGISREVLPDLGKLLEINVLKRLILCNDSGGSCGRPCRENLAQILRLAGSGTAIMSTVTPDTDPAIWDSDQRKAAIHFLIAKYADAMNYLDEEVQCNGIKNNLLWDKVELTHWYSDPAILPDAEHLLIAALLSEGLVKEVVSTNWDALLERACERFALDVRVVAAPAECSLAATVGQVSLYKIHGCASLAVHDPTKYRPFVVVTNRHREGWRELPDREPFRDKCRDLLRDHLALFLGLSVQDFHLQCQILRAAPVATADECRTNFALETIENGPKEVVRKVHGDLAPGQRQETEKKAILGLYGKPLLGSLYVYVLKVKMEHLIASSASKQFSATTRSLAEYALANLLGRLQGWFDDLWIAAGKRSSEAWRQLAQQLPIWLSRAAQLYRQGASAPGPYTPWAKGTPSQIDGDPNAEVARLDLLLAIFAVTEKAASNQGLSLQLLGSGAGHLMVTRAGVKYRIHILQLGQLEPQVISAKVAGDTAIDILVYGLGETPARRRVANPARRYAARTPSRPGHVYFEDLLRQSDSEDDLIDLFGRKLI